MFEPIRLQQFLYPVLVMAQTVRETDPGPRYWGFFRNLPTNTTVFLRDYDYVEKAALSNGYQNPNKWG